MNDNINPATKLPHTANRPGAKPNLKTAKAKQRSKQQATPKKKRPR